VATPSSSSVNGNPRAVCRPHRQLALHEGALVKANDTPSRS